MCVVVTVATAYVVPAWNANMMTSPGDTTEVWSAFVETLLEPFDTPIVPTSSVGATVMEDVEMSDRISNVPLFPPEAAPEKEIPCPTMAEVSPVRASPVTVAYP